MARPALRADGDLGAIALVPYLIGFHPQDSMVLQALRDRRLAMTIRLNLPGDAAEAASPVFLDPLAALAAQVAAEKVTIVQLIGYGKSERVGLALAPVTTALQAAGLKVGRTLRVEDGRYYCLDQNCTACPPEGTAYDLADSPVAAELTYLGRAALPDREALASTLDPVSDAARVRMRAATEDARATLATLRPEELMRIGAAAIANALEAAEAGQQLSDDDAARLTVLLTRLSIRDEAWRACDCGMHQRALWTDLTRRAEPELAAAPASLLGFNAYLAGDGALADIAFQRALEANPGYTMASLLRVALRNGIHPNELRRFREELDS